MTINPLLLTICVFTRNRPEILQKTLRYLGSIPVQVFVADASTDSIQVQLPKNVHYQHFPNASLIERFRYFAMNVKSKYVLLSPDDDFYVMRGLEACLDILEAQEEIASVQGLRIRIIPEPKFRWIPHDIHQLHLKYDNDEALTRLLGLAPQSHYLYSIMRIKDFQKIIRLFDEVNPSSRDSFAIHELVFNYALPLLGKHYVVPAIYSARTFHPYEGSDIIFGNWITDNFDLEATRFRKNVVDFYSSILSINQSDAKKLETFITNSLVKDSSQNPSNSKENLKGNESLLRLVKEIVNRSLLRKLYPVSKISYLEFFFAILIAGNYRAFKDDKNRLFKYLKH